MSSEPLIKSKLASKTVWGIALFIVGYVVRRFITGDDETTRMILDFAYDLMIAGGGLTAYGIRAAQGFFKS